MKATDSEAYEARTADLERLMRKMLRTLAVEPAKMTRRDISAATVTPHNSKRAVARFIAAAPESHKRAIEMAAATWQSLYGATVKLRQAVVAWIRAATASGTIVVLEPPSAEAIRRLRGSLGLTQVEFADALGIRRARDDYKRSTISMLESGTRPGPSLTKSMHDLAEKHGVNIRKRKMRS